MNSDKLNNNNTGVRPTYQIEILTGSDGINDFNLFPSNSNQAQL